MKVAIRPNILKKQFGKPESRNRRRGSPQWRLLKVEIFYKMKYGCWKQEKVGEKRNKSFLFFRRLAWGRRKLESKCLEAEYKPRCAMSELPGRRMMEHTRQGDRRVFERRNISVLMYSEVNSTTADVIIILEKAWNWSKDCRPTKATAMCHTYCARWRRNFGFKIRSGDCCVQNKSTFYVSLLYILEYIWGFWWTHPALNGTMKLNSVHKGTVREKG